MTALAVCAPDYYHSHPLADVAKLADAQDSGSCGVKPVEVQFLLSAYKRARLQGRARLLYSERDFVQGS